MVNAPGCPWKPIAVAVSAAVLAGGCGGGGRSTTADGDARASDAEELVRAVDDSIVSVEVTTRDGWQGGTGVVWSRNGLVVTANHVVENGRRVIVRDVDGEESEAEVVATDAGLDLALLRVPRTDLVAAAFSRALPRVGDVAVTIGRPPPDGSLRWEPGSIEALHSSAFRTRGWDDLVQSSADVRHGDSGGAMVGPGPVVDGIVLASDLEGGIDPDEASERTYAVAAPLVRGFVADALSGREREPGFLGVDAADVTPELRERHGLDFDSGVVVLAVEPGTPADEAGLRYRDVLVTVDGEPVERLADLDAVLRRSAAGSRIAVGYARGDERRTATVVLAARPRS